MRIDDMNGGLTDPEPAPAENDIRSILMQELQKEQMQQMQPQMPPGPGVPLPASPPGSPTAPGPGASPDPMMMAQALRG